MHIWYELDMQILLELFQSQTQSKVNKKNSNGGQKDNWGLKLGHKL